MATYKRASGVTVETTGAVVMEDGQPKTDDSGPILTPPRPGRRRGRPTARGKRRAPGPRTLALPNEGDLIAEALVDRNLKLVDAVPLRTTEAPPRRRRPGRRR